MKPRNILLILLTVGLACATTVAKREAGSPQVTQASSQAAPAPPEPKTLEEAQRLVATQWRRLQDWAQLGRYASANAALEAPKPGERRVVFLGDSITDGWKLAEYFPGKPYVNRGISGQTTPQMLVRMRPDVIERQPQVVVILAGTNDIAGNTGPMTAGQVEENYASLAELARAHGIRVVFSSVLPVHDKGSRGAVSERRRPEEIRALNEWLKQYCAQNRLVYLDYYSHMLGEDGMLRTELSGDGLHPNAEGYKIMAPLAQAAIEKALRSSK